MDGAEDAHATTANSLRRQWKVLRRVPVMLSREIDLVCGRAGLQVLVQCYHRRF